MQLTVCDVLGMRILQIFTYALVASTLYLCNAQHTGSEYSQTGSNHRPSWDEARSIALQHCGPNGTSVNRDRLALVYLYANINPSGIIFMRGTIAKAAENLFPTTPTTVYVFTLQVEALKKALGEWVLPNVLVLPMTNESWTVHPNSRDERFWHLKGLKAPYRLMGTWRLSYPSAFARDLGHRYMLQMDDDSFILSPVGFNIVERFDRQGILLAARNIVADVMLVMWGIPELARYFLVTHKIVPTTLFEYCNPPNMTGLYSRLSQDMRENIAPAEVQALEALRLPNDGGWGGPILYGNCLAWSLDWWFQPEVQRFIHLALASGGVIDYRWVDQPVIAMLWQIFVRKDQFFQFDFHYDHGRGQNLVDILLPIVGNNPQV